MKWWKIVDEYGDLADDAIFDNRKDAEALAKILRTQHQMRVRIVEA